MCLGDVTSADPDTNRITIMNAKPKIRMSWLTLTCAAVMLLGTAGCSEDGAWMWMFIGLGLSSL